MDKYYENKVMPITVVYDNDSKDYAYYLIQLIGTRKQKINAIMWDEKQYRGNEMVKTSREKMIFIGQSEYTKMVNEKSDKRYSRYGIEYGWLGNRAAIMVNDERLSKDDYEKFVKESKIIVKHYQGKEDYQPEGVVKDTLNLILGLLLLPIAFPFMISEEYKLNKFHKELRKSRFYFAVLKFFNDHLEEFYEE